MGDDLELRFTSARRIFETPNIADFCRSGGSGDASAGVERPKDIAIATRRRTLGPADGEPIVVFFELPSFTIPATEASLVPDGCKSWHVRSTLTGYLATVPRRGSTMAALIVSACLPLSLATVPAAAAPPVQQPTPPVPDDPTSLESEDSSAEDAPAAGSAESAPETSSTPEPQQAPASTATMDAAWEAVRGYDVNVVLLGGRKMSGRVGSVQPTTFALIDPATGVVRVLQKSSVVDLRVQIPAPLPQQEGTGMLVGGITLTVLGAPVFLAGVTFLALCPSCAYIHLPMLLIGGGALGAGIPLTVGGAKRRRAYRRAQQERGGLQAVVGRTRFGGWTGGLRFRF